MQREKVGQIVKGKIDAGEQDINRHKHSSNTYRVRFIPSSLDCGVVTVVGK